MNPTMVGEDEQSFTMSDGQSPFKVPKAGLSESLQAKIRGMADVGTSMPPPVTTFSLPPVEPPPAPSMPAARAPVSGESLGLKTVPLGATVSLPPPTTAQIAPGLQVAPQAEKTLVGTGRVVNGMPVVEEATGFMERPLPSGLRLRGEELLPPPPPVAAPVPVRSGPPAALPGMASIRSGIADQQDANAALGAAKAEEGRATADALSSVQRQLEANALEDKARIEAADARVSSVMAQYKAAQDEMRNVSTTVDPGRYWATRSTGGKIASIIGLALGALGAGPDGVNRAAMMMNQAIDRDLEAQKAEHTLRLQKGKASIDAAQSAYAMEHTRFGDEASARAAAKANLLGLAQNKLAQITAGTSSPQAKAQADALNGALEVQKGKLEQDAANDLATRAHSYAAANAARAKAPAPSASATALTEIENRNATIHNSGRKLLALIDAYGTSETVTPGIEGQMSQLANDMAVDAAKLKDPTSVARPGEVELELQNLFKPGMWQRDASARAKIQSFLDNAESRRATAYSVRGLPPPQAAK